MRAQQTLQRTARAKEIPEGPRATPRLPGLDLDQLQTVVRQLERYVLEMLQYDDGHFVQKRAPEAVAERDMRLIPVAREGRAASVIWGSAVTKWARTHRI